MKHCLRSKTITISGSIFVDGSSAITKVLLDQITLPKSATMPDIFKLEEQLAQAAGIEEHPYIFLSIDRSRNVFSYSGSPPEFSLQSVSLRAINPFSYKRKIMWAKRPKHGEFVVSIASLKKKIEKLEAWYQSQIELEEQKDKERQDCVELIKQCKADGLPMFPAGRSHWFEAMNGRDTLSVSVARRFTREQAIALNDFLNKLIQQDNP